MEKGLSNAEIESLRSIISELEKLNHRELFSYWINAELEEAETYNELAKRIKEYGWDSRIPRLFKLLAGESIEHAEILLGEYNRIYGGEPLAKPDIPSIELEVSMERLEEYIRKGRIEDLVEILMESEKLAQEVYQHLSENADGETKRLLEMLARVEEGHYQRLKELKESL